VFDGKSPGFLISEKFDFPSLQRSTMSLPWYTDFYLIEGTFIRRSNVKSNILLYTLEKFGVCKCFKIENAFV